MSPTVVAAEGEAHARHQLAAVPQAVVLPIAPAALWVVGLKELSRFSVADREQLTLAGHELASTLA